MKTGMLALVAFAATLACSKGEVVAPSQFAQIPEEVPGGAPPNGHFVSPNGSSAGDGSYQHPWNLATALAQPSSVVPGDTIWMMGGTYKGPFVSKLTGTPAKPVVLRQLANQRATVDGRFEIDGSYTYYWGFEVMDSDPKRVTTISGSDPTDLPREYVTVYVIGPFNKIINLVIHDLGDGLFSGSSAEGLEINGTLLYNNGWDAPDRGHGHSLYLQNKGATKYILDNVMFNSFSSGLKVAGTGDAFLFNFDIEGNTSFSAGGPVVPTHGYIHNTHYEGGGGNLGHVKYIRNSFYHVNGNDEAFRMNAAGDPVGQDMVFSNNIVQGVAVFNEWQGYVITGNKFSSGQAQLAGQAVLLGFRKAPNVALSTNQWDNNSYAAPLASPKKPFYMVDSTGGQLLTLPEWATATGYDKHSTYQDAFTTPDIIVRPSRYEPGRAFITCWNWQKSASLPVDVSNVLKPGDSYEVHHVYDVFGPPVVSGKYDGRPITIPQTDRVPPTPLGYNYTPPSMGIQFNVFLLTRR